MRLSPLLCAACLFVTVAYSAAAGPETRLMPPMITEFQPNPEGSDRGQEWVEIHNPGVIDVDLEGWQLEDNRGRSLALDGLVLAGRDHLVVQLPGNTFNGVQLANAGGVLKLMSPGGGIVDYVAYGSEAGDHGPAAAPEGESIARYTLGTERPYGKGTWYVNPEPSPGEPNALMP